MNSEVKRERFFFTGRKWRYAYSDAGVLSPLSCVSCRAYQPLAASGRGTFSLTTSLTTDGRGGVGGGLQRRVNIRQLACGIAVGPHEENHTRQMALKCNR